MTGKTYNEAAVMGLADKLRKTLSSLTDVSRQLQQAVIRRDVDTIWALLAQQEKMAGELDHHLYLWREVMAGGTQGMSPALVSTRQDVDTQLYNLRVVGGSTAALIKSFLAAIGKAIRTTTSKIARKTNVYSSKGKMQMKQSSLLVNSVG